ncbi:MAG TPA: tetratricopeptide repeat protein [Candidatus Brocadiia bacterium]|nr:tetratricopeptide repeat protein [Candidatus Brocadiia bacterium]
MASDSTYKKACDALDKGNYDYAIELFRAVLKSQPENMEARVALRGSERRKWAEKGNAPVQKAVNTLKGVPAMARALAAGKDPRKRLEAFEDFLELNPRNTFALLGAARAARAAGFNEASTIIYKDTLMVKADQRQAMKEIAELYENRGDTETALKYYEPLLQLERENQALREHVKNLEARHHMAKHQLEDTEDFRSKVKDLDKQRQLEVDDKRYHTKDELEDALKRATETWQADPNNVTKAIRVAEIKEQLGDAKDAMDFYKEFHAKDKNNIIRDRMGDLQFRMIDAKISELVEQLKKSPDKAELKEAQAEMRRKRRLFAVQEFERRVKQYPTDKDLRMKMGAAYLENDQVDEAIENFQIASQDPRLTVSACNHLGQCFDRKGQYDLASAQFARALERVKGMNEMGKQIYYNLARAYEHQGEKEKALETYKKIYQADIKYRDVQSKVEELGAG